MELGQIILRLSAYSIGVAVGLFATRYWVTYNRRWGYAMLAMFTVVSYGSGLLSTLSLIFTGIPYAHDWVRFIVLATIGYVNPVLLVLVMRADMRKDKQRERAIRLAMEMGLDPNDLLTEERKDRQ